MNMKILFMSLTITLIFVGFGFFYKKESTFEKQLVSEQSEFIDFEAQILSVIDGPDPLLILEKLKESEEELEKTILQVGSEKINYYETRNGRRRKFTDVEKEIALSLLNLKSGETELIKIVKKGGELVNNSRFEIEVVERSSGISWNNFNTIFKIASPSDFVVLKVKYPLITEFRSSGHVIKEVVYAPYNPELHFKEIINEGEKYLEEVDFDARNELNFRKVQSKAFPNKLVTEVVSSDWIKRIPFLEQTDFGEFLLEPQERFERVLWLLGANKERAYYNTQSYASALGWVQFTPRTYASIRDIYSEAQLIYDFDSGARSHKNSLIAAYLLYDNNMIGLISKFSESILEDPLLEEYLAAGYNGRPSRAHDSIDIYFSNNRVLDDWTSELKDETKEFLEKLRYLKNSFEI